jgi:hypothetical protein
MLAMELISIDYDVLLSYIKQYYWLKKSYGIMERITTKNSIFSHHTRLIEKSIYYYLGI